MILGKCDLGELDVELLYAAILKVGVVIWD